MTVTSTSAISCLPPTCTGNSGTAGTRSSSSGSSATTGTSAATVPATSPSIATTSSTSASTTTMSSTTSVSTATALEAQVYTGEATFEVDDPEALLDDVDALEAVRAGIAEAYDGVSMSWVTIANLTLASRRLSSGVRGLTASGGAVVITYVIEAPAAVTLEVNTATLADAMSGTMQTALDDAGIAVNVASVVVAEPVVVFFTTSTAAATAPASLTRATTRGPRNSLAALACYPTAMVLLLSWLGLVCTAL
mmetsp:Transcript_37069/g.83801  ORF Transcript_37069/g.83801 Transcript_37069/m.83801 type:complete len:251 (-) Transcript_37069:181-933(-)